VRRSHGISPRECQAQIDAELDRGKLEFEAFDANDASLGLYPTARAAALAISTRGT
jgi:hypothetical protein